MLTRLPSGTLNAVTLGVERAQQGMKRGGAL